MPPVTSQTGGPAVQTGLLEREVTPTMKRSASILLVIALMLALPLAAHAAPAAQGPVTHVVQRGESLSSIANRYGVSLAELARTNGLGTRSWLYAGQSLNIPQKGGSAATAPAGGAHVVQAGETLASIARRYGTTVAQLVEANGLASSQWIYAGQRLVVSGAQNVPAASQSTSPQPASGVHIVKQGETLNSIATRYGVSTSDLARANNVSVRSWVYTGQRLSLPGPSGEASSSAPAAQQQPQPASAPQAAAGNVHVVQRGETLGTIATRYGTNANAIARANNLPNTNFIYAGQRLTIPGRGSSAAPAGASAPPPAVTASGQLASADTPGQRWIDVNLSQQMVTAYAGNTPVYTARASTGLPRTPTVTGTYRIYAKYQARTMSGPGYHLPNVPHVMFFYRGYSLHGTYWHSNFGQPMSHGCVNLSRTDAAWFYQWASVGTPVKVHH